MKRLVAIVALAASFAVTPGALARSHHHAPVVRTTALALAQAAAVRYWGARPCGGSVAVLYAPASPMSADTDGVLDGTPLWAWTTFQTPTGPEDWSQPPSGYTDCTVTLNSAQWSASSEGGKGGAFPDFCGLIVHEYGHLFGHPDRASDSPHSITYPLIGPANDRVRPCVARYRLAALLS